MLTLEGARADEPGGVRGMFNEYLRSDLAKHRKVFEVIGKETRCDPAETQLSGLGFSSTVNNNFTVRVDGKRTYKVGIKGGSENV